MIQKEGMKNFLLQQKARKQVLRKFLNRYDDGRSKSFYCLSCALLPVNDLQHMLVNTSMASSGADLKEKNKRLKQRLQQLAGELNIELKLNKKAGS